MESELTPPTGKSVPSIRATNYVEGGIIGWGERERERWEGDR